MPTGGPRLGFVVPRFGAGIVGGAEIHCQVLVENLVANGVDAEVLTTCAVDHLTWEDHLPAGTTVENGVTVHREPVDPRRDNGRFFELHDRLARGLPSGRADEIEWMAQSVWSPELQDALEDEDRYDWIIPMPYLFGTTFWAVAGRPERTALIPCLHDEAHAWLPSVRAMITAARGCMYNSQGEGVLLARLAPDANVRLVSIGYDEGPPPTHDAVAAFCAARGIAPGYLLYAGRRETGKGLPDLFAAYARLVARRPDAPPLALMGRGELVPPPGIADRVVDLGFVPDEDRDTAFAAAGLLVNPSRLESLGMVVLEAWLAGTACVVSGGSPVLREHCRASGGGLPYGTPDEFVEALEMLMDDPDMCRRMARDGARYVRETYNWDRVRERLFAALEEWS